jgi:predicted GH43/DUF377 family glycosyl hydrolase
MKQDALKSEVLKRYSKNPILKPEDMPIPCCAVYNSGCVKTAEGQYIMASRFEKPNKKQFTWISRSQDGYNFIPDKSPVTYTCSKEEQEEYDATTKMTGPGIGTWYDPRINPVNDEYYITYAAVSKVGCRIGIGKTNDFKTVKHVSFPLTVPNRNAVLFPEKINGKYVMLHRPQHSNGTGSIWITESADLQSWANCKPIANPENFWEVKKIGPGAPPIRTREGWLILFHGVSPNCNGLNYGIGAMLLDLDNPSKVIARAKDPIMFVEKTYEMIGQVGNVIFPGAVIPEKDGTVKVYYGAADFVQCLATGTLDDLIQFCFKN